MSLKNIQKAREGDEESFQRLLDDLKKTIDYYSKRAKINGFTEQDIRQEIHVTIYKGVFIFDDEKGKLGYKTFFQQLISRHLYNLIQRQFIKRKIPSEKILDIDREISSTKEGKAASVTLIDILDVEEQPFEYKDPAKQLEYEEELGILYEYIEKNFSDMEKKVIECVKKGVKTAEISTITGLPYKSVDNTKQRIKKKLERFKEGVEEDEK